MRPTTLLHATLLSCLVAAPTLADSPVQPQDASRGRPTSVYARQREQARRAAELRRVTREALQREASAEGAANQAAVEDLIDVYIALRLDQSLTDAERRRLAGIVRSRLLRAHARLTKDVPKHERPDHTASANDAPDAARSRLADRQARRAAETVANVSQLVLAQQGVAGPAGAAAGGMLGGAALPFANDYGNDLADLIQTVIAPSTWERSGGPGSIYYFQPRQVLVIRQTGDVHARIGRVIEDLRQAGN